MFSVAHLSLFIHVRSSPSLLALFPFILLFLPPNYVSLPLLPVFLFLRPGKLEIYLCVPPHRLYVCLFWTTHSPLVSLCRLTYFRAHTLPPTVP